MSDRRVSAPANTRSSHTPVRTRSPSGLAILGAVALAVGASLPYAKVPRSGQSLRFLYLTNWGGPEHLGHLVSVLLLIGAALVVATRADAWFAGGVLYAGGWLLLFGWAAGVIPFWWSGVADALPTGVLMPFGSLLLGVAGSRVHRAMPEPEEIRAFDPRVTTHPGVASLLLIAGLALAVAFSVPSLGVGFAAVDPRHLFDLNSQTPWSTIELVIAFRLILQAARASNEGRTSPFLAGAMLRMGIMFTVGPIGLTIWLARNHIGIPASVAFAVVSGLLLLISVRPLAQPTRLSGA
jgi:hypothetical protein